MTAPWERQEGETEKAFRAFVLYRDARSRSIRGVAASLGHTGTGAVSSWSSRWRWLERAKAFDDHLAAAAVEAAREAHEATAVIRARVGRKLLLLVEAWVDDAAANPDRLGAIKAADLERIYASAHKGSSLDDGKATERTESTFQLGDDDLNELLADPELRGLLDRIARDESETERGK